MSDGISDMHREEERKAAELVEKCCANCINSESSCDSGICSLCSGHLEFCPSLKAIDAKVEELRKEQIIEGSKERINRVEAILSSPCTVLETIEKLERNNAEMLEVLKEYSVLKPLDAIGIIDGVCKLHNKTQKLIEKAEGK